MADYQKDFPLSSLGWAWGRSRSLTQHSADSPGVLPLDLLADGHYGQVVDDLPDFLVRVELIDLGHRSGVEGAGDRGKRTKYFCARIGRDSFDLAGRDKII